MATFQHFTHLPHSITEVSENKEFTCDGCERLGIGKRYQCKECSFNLHLHCGHCPIDLCSFMHRKHQLHLTLLQRSRPTSSLKVNCEVCGVNVGGLFYQCKRCNLYIHPLCSQLPQYVRHTSDAEHILELRYHEESESCTVCQEQCSRWYYRCGACPVSLHINCLLKYFVPSSSVEKERSTHLSVWPRLKRTAMASWLFYFIFILLFVQLVGLIMGFKMSYVENDPVKS